MEAEGTVQRRVSVMLAVTPGSGPRKGLTTLGFEKDGVRVHLDKDGNPPPDQKLTPEQERGVQDFRGVQLGRSAKVRGRVVTFPGRPEKWAFDEKWQPKDWPRPPDAVEAIAIHHAAQAAQVARGEGKSVRNPLDLMREGGFQ